MSKVVQFSAQVAMVTDLQFSVQIPMFDAVQFPVLSGHVQFFVHSWAVLFQVPMFAAGQFCVQVVIFTVVRFFAQVPMFTVVRFTVQIPSLFYSSTHVHC